MELSLKILGVIILFLCVGLLVISGIAMRYKGKHDRAEKNLKYYRDNWLRKQGWTTLWKGSSPEGIHYNLQSFDGGKNWYALDTEKKDQTFVLGLAEDVYPGLIASLSAWDKITEHVEKNGAIGTNPITPEIIQMLESGGLTIKQKNK